MEPSQCPLEPNTFVTRMLPMGLCQVEEMEHHISSSRTCHHPPLKDLVCSRGTTPLLLACSYGDLEAVKRIIEYWEVNIQAPAVCYANPSRDLNEKWCCEHIDGASPLFVAACNGHLDIVRYLVEKGTNVNAVTENRIGVDSSRVGLTPLHGAFLPHLGVVRCSNNTERQSRHQRIVDIVIFLLKSGADPNVLPLDRSPIWRSTLCGVEGTIALINHGLDLNQCCSDAPYSTIIHDWAGRDNREKDSIVIVKLLVEKGANLLVKDGEGFTPLLRAAYGHSGHGPNLEVLDFLLERDEFSRMEKIDAMELAGAVILNTFSYPESSFKAFDYWRRALQLRQIEMEGAGPINKIPLQWGSGGGNFEWVTSEQLEHVVQHSSEHKYQAFLVAMRILSCKSSGALVSLLQCRELSLYRDDLTRQRAAFVKLLHLSWATLESLGRFEEDELDPKYCVKETTNFLVNTLSGLRNDPSLFTIETITTSLQYILKTDHILFEEYIKRNESYFIEDDFQDIKDESYTIHMETLLKLVELLAGLPRQMLENNNFKDSFQPFVQRARRDENGRTLLLMACKPSYLFSNPSIMTSIRLLLDFGADPSETDLKGNAPLHVLARFNHRDKKLVASAANLLLSKGAHLDQVNNSRKTAADVWIGLEKKKRERRWYEDEGTDDEETEEEEDVDETDEEEDDDDTEEEEDVGKTDEEEDVDETDEEEDDEETEEEEDDEEIEEEENSTETEEKEEYEVEAARWKDLLPSWLRDDSVPKLQCLTARVIRTNKVPFSRLPPRLHRFVKMH